MGIVTKVKLSKDTKNNIVFDEVPSETSSLGGSVYLKKDALTSSDIPSDAKELTVTITAE